MYIIICIYVYMYIYIYIKRERERDQPKSGGAFFIAGALVVVDVVPRKYDAKLPFAAHAKRLEAALQV